jgi:Outer membrane protein Omp28/Secretion system C-terminal sorting domain
LLKFPRLAFYNSIKSGKLRYSKSKIQNIMKNITKILFAGALALPVIGNAQNANVSTTPENRNAVIEEWTGIHCGYCPTGHAAVQAAYANNPGDVVAINIHSGGYAVPSGGEPDYRTTNGDAHDAAFGPTGYPSSTLNRRTIGGEQLYHPAGSNDADKVPTVIAEQSEVNVNIVATLDIVTRQLDVAVEYYYTGNAPSGTNELYVAILQNNMHGPQTSYDLGNYNPGGWIGNPANGVYNHMHMFRGMMSAQWGDAINSTTTGSTATVNYSQVLPMDINGVPVDIANIQIAAFINDGTQTGGDVLTGSTAYPTLTGFTATDEVIWNSANTDDIETCDLLGSQTISPTTNIQNWGSNAMTSATITYDINGGTPVVMNWTGNIAPGGAEEVTLNAITFTPLNGNNDLNVTVSNPNGVADNTSDNSGSYTFQVVGPATTGYAINVDFFTDNYAGETSWEIRSSGGTVVASGGPYTVGTDDQWGGGGPDAQTTMSSTHTLPNGTDCYSVRLLDNYGDGQQYGTGTNPQGGFGIEVQSYGNVIFNWDGGSGWSQTDHEAALKTDASSSLGEISIENVSIFPNPASDVLNVNFNVDANEYTVSILDLQGRVLASESGSQNVTFPVADLASGSYLVTISTENGVHTESVVIK